MIKALLPSGTTARVVERKTYFFGATLSRFDNFVDSVENLIGRPLTQCQLDDANEAFLEGESAVEFALTFRSTSLDQGPP